MRDTQNQAILARLELGPLTQLQAYDELGVSRLGARIHDLRSQGHNIRSCLVNRHNRHGDVCRVAEYSLEKG